MRKLFLILAISVAIAILYGAETRAAALHRGGESSIGANDRNGHSPPGRLPANETGMNCRAGFAS